MSTPCSFIHASASHQNCAIHTTAKFINPTSHNEVPNAAGVLVPVHTVSHIRDQYYTLSWGGFVQVRTS